MGCPRPPFASFLRLACRPRAPLEEPELFARRKELQSERLRLRPEIQELLVLGGSRELPGVLSSRQSRSSTSRNAAASMRSAALASWAEAATCCTKRFTSPAASPSALH